MSAEEAAVGPEQAAVGADWQGLLPEEAAARREADDQFTPSDQPELRHSARHLLADLLRPHRRAIVGVLLVAVIQVGATMAAPWLVGIAIDNALPEATGGNYWPLVLVTIWLVVCAVVSGSLRAVFVLRSRPDRPGGPLRPASPRLRPCARAVRVVPRALHVRAGDLPADLRYRHAHRAAGFGPGRPDHRGAEHRRDRGAHVPARPATGRDRARLADPVDGALPVVRLARAASPSGAPARPWPR